MAAAAAGGHVLCVWSPSTAVVLDYLAIAGIVFALNLLPAFGPPTALVLVALTLSFDVSTAPLVAAGAVGAACGRFVLAEGARALRPRFSAERRESLDAAADVLKRGRGKTLAALGLFALAPVPSAQLFIAAGVMDFPLLQLTAAFFVGRVVSYTLYVTAAGAVKDTAGEAITATLVSPVGIIAQLLALAGLVVLFRVDWAKIVRDRAARRSR